MIFGVIVLTVFELVAKKGPEGENGYGLNRLRKRC